MKYSLTVFQSPKWWKKKERYIYDNKTHRRMDFDSWDKFEDFLRVLSTRPIACKQDAELISPAVFQPGTTRANANVIEWAGWAAIDIDQHDFKGDLENELNALFGNWYYVCYSTASSTNDTPKFRLVLPLKSAVRSDRLAGFWFALNTEFNHLGDRQTKDLSRMYYTPASYAGANSFFFVNRGSHIDPDALISKHPMPKKEGKTFFDRLPEEMQRMIVQHKKDQAENNGIRWTSYKDCPFVSKKSLANYTAISQDGWYVGMYKLMVAIASRAVQMKYPITPNEVAMLAAEVDADNGGWYKDRPLTREAENAIDYVYHNVG